MAQLPLQINWCALRTCVQSSLAPPLLFIYIHFFLFSILCMNVWMSFKNAHISSFNAHSLKVCGPLTIKPICRFSHVFDVFVCCSIRMHLSTKWAPWTHNTSTKRAPWTHNTQTQSEPHEHSVLHREFYSFIFMKCCGSGSLHILVLGHKLELCYV